jgi:putative DNA primase/helicase
MIETSDPFKGGSDWVPESPAEGGAASSEQPAPAGPLAVTGWHDAPAILRRVLGRLRNVRKVTYKGGPAWQATDPFNPSWYVYVQLCECGPLYVNFAFPDFDRRVAELQRERRRKKRRRSSLIDEDLERVSDSEEKHEKRVLEALGLTNDDLVEEGQAPPVFGAVSLAAVEARETRWLWPSWLRASAVSVVEGVAGADTRAVLLSLAGIVSGGQAFPDGAPSDHARDVLLLAPDPDLADVQRCLLTAGGQLERIQVLREQWWEECFGGEPCLRRQGSPGVEDLLRLCGNTPYRLIVITPLESYWSGDRHAETFADQLARLARESGAAVVLGRQANGKGRATRALHRVAGSVLLCAPDPADRDNLIVAVRHNDLAAHRPSLVARAGPAGGLPRLRWQGETHWTAEELLAGPGRKALQEDSALRRAMKFLAEMVIARGPHDMLPLVKLGKDNGHSLGTLKRAKKELGIVSLQDHEAPGRPWKWAPPPAASGSIEQGRSCAPALRPCSDDGSDVVVNGCAIDD